MLYPLRFTPLYRRYIWGGRRLATMLNKPIGPESDFAESWEIVDHGLDQSTVAYGPLTGANLQSLVRSHGRDLLGSEAKQFPLLFKYLDAQRDLSVQVHPNDTQAAQLDPPDLGKTEAWVIVHADPGSVLYAGLKPGVDRSTLLGAIGAGTSADCLHQFQPSAGDCIFIQAGTVHALGSGLVVAEIQQASDTTFRLFDWNRVGQDGKPRPLHIGEAMEVIDFDIGPVTPQSPIRISDQVEQIVDCEKFSLSRVTCDSEVSIAKTSSCHIVSVLEGTVSVSGDAHHEPLRRGETILIPACCHDTRLSPHGSALLLDMTSGNVR